MSLIVIIPVAVSVRISVWASLPLLIIWGLRISWSRWSWRSGSDTTDFMTKKPLIVFDLVATLTDAGPRYAEAYVRMCEAWNIEPPARQDILSALGNKNLKQIIAEFTPELAERDIGQFMNECNSACDTMLYNVHWHEDLFPGVRECLQRLTAAGHELGIFTGTREDALASQLRYHNITQHFQPQYLQAKDNARDAGMDNELLKSFQLRKIIELRGDKNIIVIGDSFADYKAAEREGLTFIAFAPNAKSRDVWQKTSQQVTFGNYDALPAILERYGNPSSAPAKKSGPRL